jgi:hypothetical protein
VGGGGGDETGPGAEAGEEDGRGARARREPTWRSAVALSAATAAVVVALLTLISKVPIGEALIFGGLIFIVSIPINHYTDRFLYRRRLATSEAEGAKKR